VSISALSFAANPLPTRLDAAEALVDEIFVAQSSSVMLVENTQTERSTEQVRTWGSTRFPLIKLRQIASLNNLAHLKFSAKMPFNVEEEEQHAGKPSHEITRNKWKTGDI